MKIYYSDNILFLFPNNTSVYLSALYKLREELENKWEMTLQIYSVHQSTSQSSYAPLK